MNLKHVAEVLRRAQCDGPRRHVDLLDGRAGPCQEYPVQFVKLVCEGIKKEIQDVKWRTKLCNDLDITDTVETLMEATAKLGAGAVP